MATLTALLVGVSACGKVQAHTPEPMPGLDVPAPPSRVVVPVTLDDPPPPAPPATSTPPPPRSRETPQTPARPPDRTVTSAPPTATPAEPAPVLQTTSNVGELEQHARVSLAAAQRDLDRVDYRGLGANARDQYDSAKRFMRQADGALRGKNFTYAAQLADKAAALASLLVK
jgi:hypothetical protein